MSAPRAKTSRAPNTRLLNEETLATILHLAENYKNAAVAAVLFAEGVTAQPPVLPDAEKLTKDTLQNYLEGLRLTDY